MIVGHDQPIVDGTPVVMITCTGYVTDATILHHTTECGILTYSVKYTVGNGATYYSRVNASQIPVASDTDDDVFFDIGCYLESLVTT
jgi:hypothetical protein